MKRAFLRIPVLILFVVLSLNLFSQDNRNSQIKIETSMGNIIIKLYNETPGHRDNMIKLAEDGFFKDQIFHRVISNFMIQGGDPHSFGAKQGQRLGPGGPGYTIPAEFNNSLFHKKGALSAARRGDDVNPEKESSGSQFYIVQGRVLTIDELMVMEQRNVHTHFTKDEVETYTTIGGAPHLDGGYTVFGEVIEGLDIMDIICNTPTDTYDRPIEDIIFNISVIKK